MSVTQFIREKRLPPRTYGGFGIGRVRDRESDLNPYERKQYRDWLAQKQTPSTSPIFGGRGGTNVSGVNIPQPDLSFSTFLKEKGYKDYVRTGLFRRKRTKTIGRASDREKREYQSWKADKQFEYNRKVKEAAENNVRSSNTETSNGVFISPPDTKIVTTPSAREKANIERLNQIKRIEAVDLSLDVVNYIGDNSIESKYPGLVSTIQEAISTYGNTFRKDEEYAQVVVTNTINSSQEVLEHIKWMITKPTSTTDVELRDVTTMGNWSLQTTADVGLGLGTDNVDLKTKPTEEPKQVPVKQVLPKLEIPIRAIKNDSKQIQKTKILPYDRRRIITFGGSLRSNRGSSNGISDAFFDSMRQL